MKYRLDVCLRERLFRAIAIGIGSILAFIVVSAAAPMDPKPIGQLINIGGRKLHIHCTGTGSPTVVVENGGAAFSFDWKLVQPQVAKFTRICTYDRAGYAWSDPGPEFDTFDQSAHDLHLLLANAGIPGPYVLVGHSLGGMLVRFYQSKYPADVVGMVLVDSSHEESLEHVGPKIVRIPEITAKQFQLLIDEGRSSHPTNQEPDAVPTTIFYPYDMLPTELQNLHFWALKRVLPLVKTWGLSLQSDLSRLHELRIANSYPLGDIPLVVLTASRFDGVEGPGLTLDQGREDHLRLQSDLAQLSTNSRQVFVSGSGHEIYLYKPDVVVRSISEVLSSVKSHSRLQSVAAAPDNTSFAGTWQGRMNDLPGIRLRIQEAGETIGGEIVFYLQKRDEPSGPWHLAGESTTPLLAPHVDGKTLAFEVQHHRCHPCPDLGPNVKFRMALAGANQARLWNLNQGSASGRGLILVRQSEATGSPAPTLEKGISVELPTTRHAAPVPNADKADSLIVTITYDGSVYLGVTPISTAELPEKLKGVLSHRAEKTLYIKADTRTAYGRLVTILDSLGTAGVEGLTLLSAQQDREEPATPVPSKGLEMLVIPPLPVAGHASGTEGR
jgi:pimeloyl-ACP methyl ester carboxylesterase/biopolymer transport protein ExbD